MDLIKRFWNRYKEDIARFIIFLAVLSGVLIVLILFGWLDNIMQ